MSATSPSFPSTSASVNGACPDPVGAPSAPYALIPAFSFDFQLLTFNFQPPLPPDLSSIPHYPPKPFPLNLFADPHSLNPVLSIFYENTGGKGPSFSATFQPYEVQTFKQVPDPSPSFSSPSRHTYTTGSNQLLCNQLVAHSFRHDGGCTPLPVYSVACLLCKSLSCCVLSQGQLQCRWNNAAQFRVQRLLCGRSPSRGCGACPRFLRLA